MKCAAPDKRYTPFTVSRLLGVAGVAALFGSVVQSPLTRAGEWSTETGITVGTYYSDNICRSRIDDEDQFVGTVRPDIRIEGEGGRFTMNLAASGEYNSLGDANIECRGGFGQQLNNREAFVPQASFDSELEAIKDWLWLEADAFAGQNAFNPFAPGGDDAINAADNTNITYRYGVGAFTQRRIGSTADFLARYNYNEQYNSIGFIGNSVQHSVDASLATRPESARLSGGVFGRFARVEFEESRQFPAFENELGSVELRAALQLSRSWQLNGAVGEEFNDFFSVLGEDIDGSFWDAGLAFTPNERLLVGAGYGKRFFGNTPRAEISYRHKRSELKASYLRSVIFQRDLRGGGGRGFGFIPGDVSPDLADLPGAPLLGDRNPTFIGQGPIQSATFLLSWNVEGQRSSFALSAQESEQTLFQTGGSATFRDATATATRQLSRHLSTDVRVNWIDRDGENAGFGLFAQTLKGWRASWGVSRTLGTATTLTLRYSYTDQTAEGAGGGFGGFINDFEEHRVDLTLRHAF